LVVGRVASDGCPSDRSVMRTLASGRSCGCLGGRPEIASNGDSWIDECGQLLYMSKTG